MALPRLALAALACLALIPSPPADARTTRPPSARAVAAPSTTGRVLEVSPTGSDRNTGAAGVPLRTIGAALRLAMPGTTIRLAPGVYRERVTTVRSGTAERPISIVGPETGLAPSGRRRATLYGTGRVVAIDHSYIRLRGFTIDGQEKLRGSVLPTTVAGADAAKNRLRSKVADGRLIYVGSAETSRGVTGVRIDDMFLHGAGGECVRMRNDAHDNAVTNSTIEYCGLYGKGSDAAHRFHNGEGVYLGTSPASTDQPMHARDTTHDNVVRGNVIRTLGSECVDIKENAHDNLVEDDDCSGNTEPTAELGSALELRGPRNTVRGNTIHDSAGLGLKVQSDAARYSVAGTTFVGNTVRDVAGAAVRVRSDGARGRFCGNRLPTPALLDAPGVPDPAAACRP